MASQHQFDGQNLEEKFKTAVELGNSSFDGIIATGTVFGSTAVPTAPRPEELKPETNALLDYLTRDILAPVSDGHENWNLASPADVDDPIQLELNQKIMSEQARIALEYYEGTQGEEYELVETEGHEAAILPPYIIYHLTFMAKPKYLSDSCPKLFFAELYKRFYHADNYEVKMCMTLDPSGPGVMKGCGYVQGIEHMLHPKDVQFWAGPPSGTPEWDEENRRG